MQYVFRPIDTWPRPFTRDRAYGPFKATYESTLRLLDAELRHLAAKDVVIQGAFRERDIRMDGLIRSDAREPEHPGIILSFGSKFGPLKYYCDHFLRWQHNLRGIALTLERLRLADLYGVSRRGEQYTGWKALPGAIVTPPPMTVEEAAEVLLGHMALKPQRLSMLLEDERTFVAAWREAVTRTHPDHGGSLKDFGRVQEARKILEAHHAGANRGS
jgi:hypothetical protein